MKTNLKNLKLIAIAFSLFALPFNALADSFDLYLCGTGTAGLIPDPTVTGTLKANDQLIWQEFTSAGAPTGSATTVTVVTNAVAPPFTVTGLAVGAHYYKVHVVTASANSCAGDVSPAFNVYSLPAPGVALGAPTNTSFCAENSNATLNSSTITATATALAPVLSDVGYEFTWTATKDAGSGAVAVADVTTVGSIAAITTPVNVNSFTLNSTAGSGAYVFKAAVKYKVSSGTLRGDNGTGCTAESAASSTITVTPKPGTPTIIIAP
ncbi:hypothetical protein [Pedobacter gandavensis]|uniref:hypothetical protein n=1 Tax=Pedobacter gandavensis TaxID=2679963 RepID=UPI00292E2AB0|nr:hypothetical protein [Pedobacter gandavensis]